MRGGRVSTVPRPASVAISRISALYSDSKSRPFFSVHRSRLMRLPSLEAASSRIRATENLQPVIGESRLERIRHQC